MWWYRQDSNLHELSALSNPSGWVKPSTRRASTNSATIPDARLSGLSIILR